ncbi:class I SAM-dependent methyltransferase [Glycocaulis sp.]|uniref:class I SAM-dependent methyltransferase n=1 Tax=Glycocaulis sp. TaxID=1969725 RepID=UPI003F713456
MYTKECVKIFSTSGSINGARRLASLIPLNAEALLFEKEKFISTDKVFISHNTRKIPSQENCNSILYALQSVVNRALNDKSFASQIVDYPPRAIYTNTATAAADLRKLGLKAECLYRPSKLNMPDEYTPLPEEPRVLLYWKADHPPMAAYRDAVTSLIRSLPEVQFWTFPDKVPPVDAPNVKALGRIRMEEVVPQVHGMVRICDRYDYGRSTFDVLLYGRWVLYNDMPDELFSLSAPLPAMAETVSKLVSERSEERARKQFDDVTRYFSEAELRRRWANAILPHLDGEIGVGPKEQAAVKRFCTQEHQLDGATLRIDRLTGEVSLSGGGTLRELPKGQDQDMSTGPVLVSGPGPVEIKAGGGKLRWRAFVGKSPVGYFITSPMAEDRFEACNQVHGYLHQEQALALFHAGRCATPGAALVEIGAYHGKSTNFLAEGTEGVDASIVSVDTFENHAMTEGLQPTFEAYSANVQRFGDRVRPVKGFSHEVVDQTPDSINYLFIDGDHSLKGCATDLKYYYHRVVPAGVISFDDYYDKSPSKRVKRVVDHFVDLGLLTFITEARSHAVTVKSPASAVVCSPKSGSKGKATHKALKAAGQRAFVVSSDGLRAKNEAAILADSALHAAEHVVSINYTKLPAAVRKRCTLVLLNAASDSLSADPQKQTDLCATPFAEVIVPHEDLAQLLRGQGINAKAMELDSYLASLRPGS